MIDICCFEQTLEYTEQGKTVRDVGLVKKSQLIMFVCLYLRALRCTWQGRMTHSGGVA